MSNLSILIPTYNRPHFLREALLSILNAFEAPVRVVVGDNGNAEITKQLLSEAALQRLNVRHLVNPSGCTYVDNLARLVEACETEWLCILHDDDFFCGNVQDAVMPILQRSDIDFIFSDHHVAKNSGELLPDVSRENSALYKRHLIAEGVVENLPFMVADQRVCLDGFFVRRHVAKASALRKDFKVFADGIWLLQTASAARSGYYLSRAIFTYRLSDEGLTKSGFNQEESLRALMVSRESVRDNEAARKVLEQRIVRVALAAAKWNFKRFRLSAALSNLRTLIFFRRLCS